MTGSKSCQFIKTDIDVLLAFDYNENWCMKNSVVFCQPMILEDNG